MVTNNPIALINIMIMMAVIIIMNVQEPFGSVNEKYMVELRMTTKRLHDLNKCLRSFDLDRMLGGLYEFIETYVKYSPDNELKWS